MGAGLGSAYRSLDHLWGMSRSFGLVQRSGRDAQRVTSCAGSCEGAAATVQEHCTAFERWMALAGQCKVHMSFA